MRVISTMFRQLLWTWLVGISVAASQHCSAGSSFVQLASRLAADQRQSIPKLWAPTEQARGDGEPLQPEELGPAAPALSMLEIWFEPQNEALLGPGGVGEQAHQLLFYMLCTLFVVMLVMGVPFVGLGNDVNCCADFLGKSVQAGIEEFDRSILGVDVEIGHLTVNPFDGYLDCEHLVVKNPEGYSSPYLLKASRVLLDIDMTKLVHSCMWKISIEKLVFKDIVAIYEKKWATSNMKEVLQYIGEDDSRTPEERGSRTTASRKATPKRPNRGREVEFEVHRVEVQNVGVNIRLSGAVGDYVNMDVEAGDVYFRDFNAETGHAYLEDVVKELLKSLLKTIVANVAGKEAANYLT